MFDEGSREEFVYELFRPWFTGFPRKFIIANCKWQIRFLIALAPAIDIVPPSRFVSHANIIKE